MHNGKDDTLAIIDLGTQSALYLFSDRHNGRLRFGRQALRHVRLGENLYRSRLIGDKPLQRAVDALKDFAALARADGARQVLATGTRVFRWAENGASAAAQISLQTGIPFIILNEDEEARYGYAGATAGRANDATATCVIDIGGGSTELSFGRGPRLTESISLDIGAVGLTEKWADTGGERTAVALPSGQTVPWRQRLKESSHLLGVAGTVTTLAALKLGLTQYDAARVDGCQLHADEIAQFIARFSQMDTAARRNHVAMAPERADILLAGAVILSEIMQIGGKGPLTVSDRGLRHGLAQAYFNGLWPEEQQNLRRDKP